MNPIFTGGYSGHTPQELANIANSIGAMVVDIRLKPQSRLAGWNQVELNLSQTRYVHLAALGNLGRFDDGPMRLKEERSGIETIIRWAQHSPLILICGCADAAKCHRSHVSRLLAKHSIVTSELKWPEPESQTIKAISLWQPYASLIAVGAKRFETRSWQTSYRGPIAIHAAKSLKSYEICGYPAFRRAFREAGLWDSELLRSIPDEVMNSDRKFSHWFQNLRRAQRLELIPLPLGAIVATAEITDCIKTEEAVNKYVRCGSSEHIFGDYFVGRFAWKLENVKPLKIPVLLNGSQGFFNVDRSLIEGG